MRSIKIQFQDFPERYWETVEENESDPSAVLARLEGIRVAFEGRIDHSIGVNLIDESGNSLSVGLGPKKWLLIFTRVDDNNIPLDQLHSVGESNDDSKVRFYFSEADEFPSSYLVRREMAEDIVRDWVATGTLGKQVAWAYEGD